MTVSPLRVIKLGGSLLDTPAVERLPHWLQLQPVMSTVVIVGGGQQVNDLRKNQHQRELNDVQAHWLSIQVMEQTAKHVESRLAAIGCDVVTVDSAEQIRRHHDTLTIFRPERYLRDEDVEHQEPLSENWNVTSDSIAARVAATANARELVLFKSSLPASASLVDMARTGFVDPHFPTVAVTPTIRVVNAREANWPERLLNVQIDTIDD